MTMKVKVRMFILAGSASVMPPLGTLLAQYGVNATNFCNEFNEKTGMLIQFNHPEYDYLDITEDVDDDSLISLQLVVDIKIFNDKTYSFIIKKPTVRHLLFIFLKLEKGNPNRIYKKLPIDLLVLLAIYKFPHLSLYSSCNLIKGTARSLGIQIVR